MIPYFQPAKLSGDMTYDGKSLLDRDIFTLSGGEKKRLLLSMAKVSDKPIIILDEPKSGLCRGQMINMIDILQQMVPNEKIIIIVTHDYELIKNCKGKIIEFV